MEKNLTIEETKNMKMGELHAELEKRTKTLEDLGMEHKDACNFISSVINLGISSNELWKSVK